jgi:hypothetical protein
MNRKRLVTGIAASVFGLVVSAGQAIAQQAADAYGVDTYAVESEHGTRALRESEDQLMDRLDSARFDGSISQAQYDQLQNELTLIRDDERRMRSYNDGALTHDETAIIVTGLAPVSDQMRWRHVDQFRQAGDFRPLP